jgi:hypothetical protein
MNPKAHFVGRPCARGHYGVSYKFDRTCVTCTRERIRAQRARTKPRKHAAKSDEKSARGITGNRATFIQSLAACDIDRAGIASPAPGCGSKHGARPPGSRAFRSDAGDEAGAERDTTKSSPCIRDDGTRFTRDGGCVECKRSYLSRMSRAAKDWLLERQRNYDRRAARALRVLQELGIPL